MYSVYNFVFLAYVVFCFTNINQKIGWKRRLQNDLFCVKWDVKPQLIDNYIKYSLDF